MPHHLAGQGGDENRTDSSDSDREADDAPLNVGNDKARIRNLERRLDLMVRAEAARYQEEDKEAQRFENTIQAFKVALGHRTPVLLEEVPCFSGTLPEDLTKGVSLQRFLQVVERATSSKEFTEKQRIQTARKYMKGLAACQVDKPEFLAIEDWEEFKKKLTLAFQDQFQTTVLWQRLSQVRRKAKEDFTTFYARLNETALQLGLFSGGDTAPAEMAIRTALLQALPPACKFLFADITSPLNKSLDTAVAYMEEQPHLHLTKRDISLESAPLHPVPLQSTLPPSTTTSQAISWPATNTAAPSTTTSLPPPVTKTTVAAVSSADSAPDHQTRRYCQVCSETSHWTVHCRLLKSNAPRRSRFDTQRDFELENPQKKKRAAEGGPCFNCGKLGHKARYCYRKGGQSSSKNYQGPYLRPRPPNRHPQNNQSLQHPSNRNSL